MYITRRSKNRIEPKTLKEMSLEELTEKYEASYARFQKAVANFEFTACEMLKEDIREIVKEIRAKKAQTV